MKSPRFLAALAMAAVLSTGTTAHAAFNQVGGSATNGQTPIQQGEVIENNLLQMPANLDGDIQVDGTFTKRINNFPVPTTEGRYLRVTMPIKIDFTYDVDTHKMVSADAIVTNNSVLAKNNSSTSQLDITNEKIEMTLVDFQENTKGTQTMGKNVKFVEDVAAEISSGNTNEVLLPFEVQMTSQTGTLKPYSLQTIIANKGNLPAVEIAGNSSVTLKIDKIQGQNLGNADLITNHTSLTSHSLKLKFEYAGK